MPGPPGQGRVDPLRRYRTRRRPPSRTDEPLWRPPGLPLPWTMRRRRVWLIYLSGTSRCPRLQGYLLSPDEVPAPRSPARAAGRLEVEDLLTSPLEFAQASRLARRDSTCPVGIAATRSPGPALPTAPGRPSTPEAPGGQARVTVTWEDLKAAAAEMDRNEAFLPPAQQGDWASRLGRVELLIGRQGGFKKNVPLSIDGLLHLVGMVCSGKSTLRDILTYWYVTRDSGRKRRVTIVVGDVAETLAVGGTFSRLDCRRAGPRQTTRERNIQRLHRRLRRPGTAMIAHGTRLPVPEQRLRGRLAAAAGEPAAPSHAGSLHDALPGGRHGGWGGNRDREGSGGRRGRHGCRRGRPPSATPGLPAVEPLPPSPRGAGPRHRPGVGRHPGEPGAQRGPAAPG